MSSLHKPGKELATFQIAANQSHWDHLSLSQLGMAITMQSRYSEETSSHQYLDLTIRLLCLLVVNWPFIKCNRFEFTQGIYQQDNDWHSVLQYHYRIG